MRAYLDHASTSPVRPEAVRAVVEWLSRRDVGDPGRIHSEGMVARAAIEEAREQVAACLGARPREVVFTSGATESIATACFGASEGRGRHSVLSAVEHSAVREWAGRGPTTYVEVDRHGRLDAGALPGEVASDTGVVHCQWGNHEVGTLQPVREVVAAVDGRALVHVDAAAAVGRMEVSFATCGADLLSVSSHKLGGPAGIGALLVRRGVRLPALVVGGDQERARRGGMENVAGIVGFAAALAAIDTAAEAARSVSLTQRVLDWAAGTDGITVYGDPDERLPHIVCLGIEGIEPQPVLLGLDRAGVAVHSGSSCSTEALEPSPVLEAMGVDAPRSLRVSVGWSTTDEDIDLLLEALPRVLTQLRSLRT